MFHAHSGWYFSRLDNGAVRIQRGAPPQPNNHGEPMTVDLDPHTWASVVASVSVDSETAESHRAALALHQGPQADPVERAKVAYSCYGKVAGWKNYRGDPMPRWEDLGEKIQNCWIAAAAAAASHRPAERNSEGDAVRE